MRIEIQSSAFASRQRIPTQYTADGHNISPPLKWQLHNDSAPPRSLALICDDPDAPMGTWVHWVIYNIPASVDQLKEGVPASQSQLPDGSLQGKNSWNKIGYGGPSPPQGLPHHYHFKLYALSEPVHLQAGADKEQLLKAMSGHVLGEAELIGIYSR